MKNSIVVLMITVLFFVSCNQPQQDPNKETVFSGSTDLLVDEECASMILPSVQEFTQANKDAKVTTQTVTARDAMASLLAKKSRCIVVSREYAKDEDSLMKAFKVAPHKWFHIATDALVFYTSKDFPSDSLNREELQSYFTQTSVRLQPSLSVEPQFVLQVPNSSVYSNLQAQVLKNKPLAKKMIFFATVDSVKKYIASHQTAIGVSYLSHVAKDTANFKILKVGYTDSTNKYVRGKTVHQSLVYLEKYPFPVRIIGYLQEDARNLPYGVLSYLATEGVPQRRFLDAGIVPAYARIRLIEDEE